MQPELVLLLLKQIEGVGSIMIVCFYWLLLLSMLSMLSMLVVVYVGDSNVRWIGVAVKEEERCVPTQGVTEGIQYQKYAQNWVMCMSKMGYVYEQNWVMSSKVCTKLLCV